MVFTASENKKKQILTLLELLRKITDDQEITITDIEQGSIKLTLKGSQKSLEKIESLFKSGKLNKISGDITVENVQFTEDNCLAFTIAGDVNADEITYLKSTIIGQNLAESPKQLAEESSANPFSVKTVSTNEASKEINNKLIESIKKPNLPQPIFERTNQKEADLSGAFLRGDDLRGAILKRADLRGANLIEADLSAAILIEANLSDAKLSGANLRGAILIEADLSKADLSGADLSGANLSGADLRRADLSDANLSAAEVKNAIFTGATGITREQKRDLIRRGAIFGDNSNDRSKVLV